MNKKNNKLNKGFSLLELLISITIIGLLSTIILNSVSQSRSRAYDSKVKQQLSSFRTAAEVYFSNQEPNSYGPETSSCSSGLFGNANPVDGQPGIYIDLANLPNGTQVVCATNGLEYAVKATLYSGNEYWCVDNKGANRLIQGSVGLPVVFCP